MNCSSGESEKMEIENESFLKFIDAEIDNEATTFLMHFQFQVKQINLQGCV